MSRKSLEKELSSEKEKAYWLEQKIWELESEIERLSQREVSAREFVKRHPSLSLIDLAEFEAYLKIPEMMNDA